ncbi:unnamed protein product [Schistosoma margrebowiei]|uniref:Uncharacterized protein n=1 Tax=Schistosoma margrebowiei TaxID=48269 RepID=A0A183MSH9_9TREM|nr:unnamed protein product [Schistosoma margrebowiei]
MKTSTSERKQGIQWITQNQLDDLDFADDLALLSRTHEQMQIKTASVAAEHIASDNRSRYENGELQLDGARKDSPGQGWMENAGERPMLLHEE